MCSNKVLIGLGAIFVAFVADFITIFDITKELTFTDAEKPCKMIPGTESLGIVAEDILKLTDTLLLASSDDREQLFMWKDDGSAPR